MKTIILPYGVNTDLWKTGIVIYNHSQDKGVCTITIRNNSGSKKNTKTYNLNMYEQFIFVPDITGTFSITFECSDGIEIIALLDKNSGGTSLLTVKDLDSTIKN